MDAAGNLTDISEFCGDMIDIRLISYLDPDVAFGTSPLEGGTFYTAVRRLSAGSRGESIFITQPEGSKRFALGRPDGRGYYVLPDEIGPRLKIAPPGMAGPKMFFTIDFVDGCWFALNDYDRSQVVDVSGSGMDEGNPITMWPWNGGDNQKWRASTRNLW
jgi:hypothetical protein